MAFEDIELRGQTQASVVLLIFSDYQCPFCRRFATETEPLIEARYVKTGQIRLGYRHLPLDKIHPFARGAAIAAECAGRQGRFWQMHSKLFENPDQLNPAALEVKARDLGLEMKSFEACQRSDAAAARITADSAAARSLRISGTPVILVGKLVAAGKVQYLSVFHGAASIDDVSKALDKALEEPPLISYRTLAATGLGGVSLVTLFIVVRRFRRGRDS